MTAPGPVTPSAPEPDGAALPGTPAVVTARRRFTRREQLLGATVLVLLGSVPLWPGAVAAFVLDVTVVAVLVRAWAAATAFSAAPFLAGALPAGVGTCAWWLLVARLGVDPLSAVVAACAVAAVVAAPVGVVLLRLAPSFTALGGLVAGAAAASVAAALTGDVAGKADRFRVATGLGAGPMRWCAIWLALALFAAATAVVRVLGRSRAALAVAAWRDDPEAASTLGIRPERARLAVWTGAAGVTGAAAAVVALAAGSVSVQEAFDVRLWVVVPFVAAGLGGTRTMVGPVLGAMALVLAQRVTGPAAALAGAAVVAALVAMVLPAGPDDYLVARVAPGVAARLRARVGSAGSRPDPGSPPSAG